MKILVLGSLERARALLEPERRKARMVFHCLEDPRVTRSFSPIDPPDWILIDNQVSPWNGVPLLQSLQAMDFYSVPDSAAGEPSHTGQDCTRCRLERGPCGQLRLHCGLRQGTAAPRVETNRNLPQGEAAICFEYQAPLRRKHN